MTSVRSSAADEHVAQREGRIARARAKASTVCAEPLSHIFEIIVAGVIAGGLLLVAADVYQRWVGASTWTLNIDGRFNAVTWFHSFVLAGASMSALGLAAASAPREPFRARLWLFVGLAFAFMSFDKSISFHERLGQELEEAFGLAEEAGRVLWQAIYAPFLLLVVLALLRLVRGTQERYRRYVVVAVVLCGTKLVLEALMLPAIEWGLTSEAGVLYGIEVNIEESVQLLGFGIFLATFASMLLDAVVQREPQAA